MASGNTLLVWTAGAAELPSSGFAQWNTRNNHLVLEFDTTTQETVYFKGVMPRIYAGGNLVVYLHWSAATATTGTGGWDVTFERISDSQQDVDSDGFATAQTVTAVNVPGTSGFVTITNVTCTAGSTGTDSIAAGELFRLRIRRDVANDNAAGDLDLHAVEIKEA